MISREQIKAARAMLDWSQKVLAQKCESVSEPTIKLIETSKINSTPETLGAIQKTFEDAGIEFLPQHGIRFRDDIVTIIEKKKDSDDIYLQLLDDIYYTVKDTKSEVLHSFIDNSLSPPYIIDRERMIRSTGAAARHLVRHGDEYLLYPLDEYRWLPKGYYVNNPTAIYADKFAIVVQAEPGTPGLNEHMKKVIIIKNSEIAKVKRMEFEMLWSIGTAPGRTKAEVTYG